MVMAIKYQYLINQFLNRMPTLYRYLLCLIFTLSSCNWMEQISIRQYYDKDANYYELFEKHGVKIYGLYVYNKKNYLNRNEKECIRIDITGKVSMNTFSADVGFRKIYDSIHRYSSGYVKFKNDSIFFTKLLLYEPGLPRSKTWKFSGRISGDTLFLTSDYPTDTIPRPYVFVPMPFKN